MSRRIAAHQSRGGLSAAKPAASIQRHQGSGSRAAQAAARVAARYAQAPSYSQMQAAGAPAAQRAFQAALPGLQAASAEPLLWEPEIRQTEAPMQFSSRDWEPTVVPARPAAPTSLEAWESEFSRPGWKQNSILRPPQPAPARALRPAEGFVSRAEDGWERPALAERPWSVDVIEPVEPDLPIHAKLIEFPRELVATRKRRPRRAEGPFAAEGLERQLSIFEVDPGALFIQPEATGAAHAWQNSEWSRIELEAQPLDEPEPQDAPVALPILQQASTGRRLTAALVDGALIAGACLGSALVAAANIGHPLPAKIVEISAVSALLLAGLLYHTLFFTLDGATPGMRCARISLCTFDGQSPTRAQSRRRLGALLLSVLPVGLGIAWILFDDDHLCWHDRLSKTYLRKY